MSKDIEALIERLEKATGGDTRLDRAILEWEGWNPNGEFMKQKRWIDPSGRVTAFNSDLEPVHFYTSSVDAALALYERILPGWRWGVASHAIKDGVYSEGPYIGKPKHVDGFRAHVTKPSPLRPMPHIADARTAPIALLLALLRSLNQEESRSEESKNGDV